MLIDDVNRDRFTREVPDLVKFDRERSSPYAPVMLSTNKQVSAVSPDLKALEKIYGEQSLSSRRSWLTRMLRR